MVLPLIIQTPLQDMTLPVVGLYTTHNPVSITGYDSSSGESDSQTT